MKILVCDDLADRAKEIAETVKEANQGDIDVQEPLVKDKFIEELKKLFGRAKRCLADPQSYNESEKLRFDDVDIVIIDNNLANLDVDGTRLTAESIVGYVRAFTSAAYLVSLNKNPDVDFDLRYLVGDFTTRADLALNQEHLANPALWTGNPSDAKDGFFPWYWPCLSKVADRRRDQVDFVINRLDEAIFSALKVPTEEVMGFLSLHARGALSPEALSDGQGEEGASLVGLTFRDVFVARDRSLPIKDDRESLVNVDSHIIRAVIGRVVAADIDLWIRRDVLGPQDALIDVPHLLSRFPLLLGTRASDVAGWNGSLGTSAPPFGMEPDLYEQHIAGAKLQLDVWVPSPAFWWPKIKASEKLNELFVQAKQEEWADVVFCEDRSIFVERTPTDGTPPTEFSAEFEGSSTRRSVAKIDGIRYAPRSRFAV